MFCHKICKATHTYDQKENKNVLTQRTLNTFELSINKHLKEIDIGNAQMLLMTGQNIQFDCNIELLTANTMNTKLKQNLSGARKVATSFTSESVQQNCQKYVSDLI